MFEREIDWLLSAARAEDIGAGDVTTEALVDKTRTCEASLVAREPGILCGIDIIEKLANKYDSEITLENKMKDGDMLAKGTVIAVIAGPLKSVLEIERTVLNVIQYLSGIATKTRVFVKAVEGTHAKVLDTRKTLPGWRALAKYAVRTGGGTNHRMGLYDRVLIKDNHLAGSDLSPAEAVKRARTKYSRQLEIEIEVESVADAIAAAKAGADIIMLDNMFIPEMREAVEAVKKVSPRIIVEASGGITLDNIGDIAHTGVDWISSGALTHSVKSLDIALDVKVV